MKSNFRGVLYQERKNFTPAVECYETAIKLRKTFATGKDFADFIEQTYGVGMHQSVYPG